MVATLDIPVGPDLTEDQAEKIYKLGKDAVIFALLEMAKRLAEQTYAPILQRRGLASLGVSQWVIELGRFEILAARLAETCRWNDASNWQLCRRRC